MRLAPHRVIIGPVALLAVVLMTDLGGLTHWLREMLGPKRSVGQVSTLPPAPLPDPEPFLAMDAFMDARIDSILALTPHWKDVVESTTTGNRHEAVRRIRNAVLEFLPRAPTSERSSESRRSRWFEREGVRIDEVHLETPTGAVLPAAVLHPARPITSPAPGVLVLHGGRATWESLLTDSDYHHGFALDLAKRGFVVLAPLRTLGNSRRRSHIDTKGKLSNLSAHALAVWEATTALEYLMAEPGVDADAIGVYGISNGGEIALRLAALDERPAAVVVSNYVADRRSWWLEATKPVPLAAHFNVPANGAVVLDDANLVALVQPRPLAVVVGLGDARYAQTLEVFDDFRAVYEAAERDSALDLIITHGAHEIVVDSVIPFLSRHLVPNTGQYESTALGGRVR